MVTQPKSMATVVEVFPPYGSTGSTPTPAIVMSASVVNGAISEMAPTVVVLPTPKPPATTIFTGTGGACAPGGSWPAVVDRSGNGTKSMDHSQDRLWLVRDRAVQQVYV